MDNVADYLLQTLPKRNEWAYTLEKFAKENKIPIMEPVSMNFLTQLVFIYKPSNILEIGTAIGYSALRMHEVLPSVNIVSIEKNEKMFEIAKTNVNEHNKEKSIQLIHGDALTEIDKLISIEQTFAFRIMQTERRHWTRYLSTGQQLIHANGSSICHNVLFKRYVMNEENEAIPRLQKLASKMRDLNEWVCNQKDFYTSIVPIGDGISISIKK